MILLAHMLLGAVVGSKIHHIPLAIILAVLCHYFLDIFPHVEYGIPNIVNKLWKKSLLDFLKVFLDFSLGLLLIFLFSNPPAGGQPLIYMCAIMAIVPDAITLMNSVVENKLLAVHRTFHEGWIHYLTKQKKFPLFWRIFTQVISVIICVLLLR